LIGQLLAHARKLRTLAGEEKSYIGHEGSFSHLTRGARMRYS
jgi:hypothetical protein